jgi:Tol biopolymer transport system component
MENLEKPAEEEQPSQEEVGDSVSETEIAPSTPAKEPAPYVHVRFPKKVVWSGVIALIILVGGVLAWQFHAYQRLHDLYNTTSATLKVKEDDKFALAGVTVEVNGATYTTDDNGKVSIPRIVAGSYPVTLSKDGYTSLTSSFTIQRGDNDIKLFSLSKVAEKLYTLKGVVQNYVNATPLVDVQVSTSGQTTRTNPAGEFSFDKLPAADYTVTLSKDGYLDKEEKLTLKTDDTTAASLTLVPSGQVVFVSNRDGKRAIYIANYDGSNQHQLITPANGGEDYGPVLSPDGKWVVFASTRDGLKTSYGSPAARLYLVSRDGKDLKKVSDDVAQSVITWSPNSASFYYEGYSDLQVSQYVRHFYTISTSAIFDLGDGANVTYSKAGTLVVYTSTKDGQITLHTLTLANGERKDILTKTASYFQNLSFTSNDTLLTYGAIIDTTLHQYQVKLADSTDTELTTSQTDTRTYYPSPDGTQKVFVEERDGKRDLFLIGADGKEKRLTTEGVVPTSIAPKWDTSGKYVVVPFERPGETALYIVSNTGGDVHKIVDYYNDQSAPYTY